MPALRGSGATRLRSPDAPRDGRGIALAADAIDLLDALGLERVPVVGHDWGARVAYTLAAVVPERVTAVVALALPAGSADQERFFTGGYRRVVLDRVGHFPHREAPDEVAPTIDRHLQATAE